MDAFELIDPVLEDRGRLFRRYGSTRERAGRAQLAGRGGPEAGQGLVAQDRDEIELLVHEDDGRDTEAAADGDLLGQIEVGVAVEEAGADQSRIGFLDTGEHGALRRAVSAPDPRADQDI